MPEKRVHRPSTRPERPLHGEPINRYGRGSAGSASGRISGVRVRGLIAASMAAMVLAGCGGGGDDTADADATTPTPTTPSTSVTPSPSPTPAPTTTATPANAVAFRLTGKNLDNPKVVVAKRFWVGLTESSRAGRVTPSLRDSASRTLQRDLAPGLDEAGKKGWTVSKGPIGFVDAVTGGKAQGTVTLCMWSPSISWIHADSGKYVEKKQERWLKHRLKVRDNRVASAAVTGTCQRGAP